MIGAYLIERLKQRGISLTAREGTLQCHIPDGALGEQEQARLAAYLREHKAELLAALAAHKQPSGGGSCGFEWRKVLPTWSIAWRERWGRRANELFEQGLSWPEDEAQAFAEAWAEREHAETSRAHPGPRLRPSIDTRQNLAVATSGSLFPEG